jgi:D-threo-aldose 1-dehydrogenase
MDATESVPLAASGLRVTRLGLGTAPLGALSRAVPEEEALAVVERAHERGLRLFDTAPLYGLGLAERRLGRVLCDKPRSELVVATKVGVRPPAPPTDDGRKFADAPRPEPVFDFSYDGVLRSFEESLERLGLDRIDVAHIHDPDDHFEEALAGAFRALDRLRSEGVISAVGAGMNQADMLTAFAREAAFDCFLLAGRYTLLDQTGLAELLPLCLELGIAVIIGGVYNSGILAEPGRDRTFDYRPAPPHVVENALRIQAVCKRNGVPLKAAAIQFPFGHAAVASVLTGCRSTRELEDNVRMFEYEIPASLWEDLRTEGLIAADVPVPGASA